MPLTPTQYYNSEFVTVRYVACRGADRGMGDIEASDADTVVLPLRGAYIAHYSRNHQVLAEPNVAMIFPEGRSARISHPLFLEDDCLSIQFSADGFHEVLEELQIRTPATHGLLQPCLMAARNLLWQRLRNQLARPLEVEEVAASFLGNVLLSAGENRPPVRKTSKIMRQLEAAKAVLASHPEKNWKLTTLARLLGSSPFHLTRMFREHVGIPMHRYHVHTRLGRSIDLLLETNQDLTTIALNIGFSSHSHFTACFRQLVGLTPRRFRAAASTRLASEVRKILTIR